MTEKLNKKLAEWAGLYYQPVECAGLELGVGWIKITPHPFPFADPNYEYISADVPNFTESLDACFKWLVPKLTQLDINAKISLDYQVTCNVGIYFSNPADDDFPTKRVAYGVEKTPALALCKAVEKLIDG